MKIYLAHSISTKAEFKDSIRVANLIRGIGFSVYAAAENKKINDKSNDPTPIDIYNGDVDEIIDSDIFVVNLTGGLQDGTISEIGVVAGWNEANVNQAIYIIAYTSNTRLLQPQHYHNIASASANHLVLGMIDIWGEFVGSEQNMIKRLEEIADEIS